MNVNGKEYSGWVHDPSGYVVLQVENHELFPGKQQVYAHRLVMAEVLGRRLRRGEDVHHVNGNRTDNSPENLVLIKKSEHARMHGKVRGGLNR